MWGILTHTSLVAATRTAVWLGDPGVAPVSHALLAEQIFTEQILTAALTDSPADPGLTCFKVQESHVCRHRGETRATELKTGDVHCVKVSDQSSESQVGLQALHSGDVVTMRISTGLATKMTAIGGFTAKETVAKELVTLLQTRTEVSKKLETLQKVTAFHRGSTKTGKKQMLLNYGGVGGTTELACFNVHTSWGYSNFTDAVDTPKMMLYGESFCLCPDDQSPEVRALIAQIRVGGSVVMNIKSERVTFDDDSTELKHTVNMVEGTALVSSRSASQEASVWVQDIPDRFCVKVVQTKTHHAFVLNTNQIETGASVCFEPVMQRINDQSTLSTLSAGKNMDLTWGSDWASYEGNTNTVTATGENMIETIVVPGYSQTQVSTAPKTVQKITATYQGLRTRDDSMGTKMLVNNEWTAAELECFKVTTTWGFARLAVSDNEKMQPETSFCLRVSDQNAGVQNTIDDLSVGDHVMMDLIHELVVYEMNTNVGTKWTTTEPHYKVTITRGTQTNFDQRSVQEAKLRFRTSEKSGSDGMKYCFDTLESISFVDVEGSATEIMQNNNVCFVASLQTATILATLLTLSEGSTVEVRWQHVWVSYDMDGSGTTTSTDDYVITKIMFPTELQKVEFTRTPNVVQKLTAVYAGSTKTATTKMLGETTDGTSSEIACFTVKESKGYINLTNTEHTELQPNDEFCMCIAEQSPAVQTLVYSLENGNTVEMTWIRELVEYSTKASKREGWRKTFENVHSFTVKLGAEIQSTPASNQQATLRFVSATSAVDDPREYCFIVLTSKFYTHSSSTVGSTQLVTGDKLCVPLQLQNVQNQAKLLSLPMDAKVEVRWKAVEIFYQISRDGSPESTVEPVLIDIVRQN